VVLTLKERDRERQTKEKYDKVKETRGKEK
jgi:hypothetical protein